MPARPILTVEETRRLDAASARHGTATRILMENAGRAVAEAVAARARGRPVDILCGPGGNGGDGYVAARILTQAGMDVRVLSVGHSSQGDAADALGAWGGAITPLEPQYIRDGAVIVDALYGAGLSRALSGAAAAFADRSAALDVLAVDVPSGVPGDGAAPIGAAVQARSTVTFAALKPCHVMDPGRALCGEVLLRPIGVPARAFEDVASKTWLNGPAVWGSALPWPKRDAHKHARGHVAAISGPAGRTGAIRLSARAALRIGAGLTTIVCPPEARAEHAARLDAVMLHVGNDPADAMARFGDRAAWVIGPALGLDERGAAWVRTVVESGRPAVLDADALTLWPTLGLTPSPQTVMTPHWGEFRTLASDLTVPTLARREAALTLAERLGCIVLLKGPDTVIAAPDGRVLLSPSRASFLATAGSGDVLAGLIAGLIAQGMGAFQAAGAAAWLHASAGRTLGPGLIAEDLPEACAGALRALFRDGGESFKEKDARTWRNWQTHWI